MQTNNWRFDKENIAAFVRFFQDGCKAKHTDAIGIEIEHFVVNRMNQSAVSYCGEKGIEALLERLLPYYPDSGVKHGHLIALGNEKYVISIEPAAQLEISIAPRSRIQEIENIYREFRSLIEPILMEWGYELISTGYCRKEKSQDLSLIPKKRYEYMNQYFEEIGMYGRCMMRGTASVQCAIDYYSEADFVRTYRAAVALGPLLALLTDNAPVFQGEPWDKYMVRTFIWERVDKERCSVVAGTFEPDFGFEAYAKYLYQVPQIFVENEMGEEQYAGNETLQNLCRDNQVTPKQMDHAMSIVFPDVRLKQYIEIRVGDSMPIEYALSYAALIKGLFHDRNKLHELYQQLEQYTQFGSMTEEEVQQGKVRLIERGYDGIIYGKSAACWLEKMADLAGAQLVKEEKCYLEPVKRLIQNRISVKDELK